MCYNYGTYEELQDAYDHGWLTDDDVNLCPNHVTLGATTIFVQGEAESLGGMLVYTH